MNIFKSIIASICLLLSFNVFAQNENFSESTLSQPQLAILDIDGNGVVALMSDDLLIFLYLFGFSGDALCGIAEPDATRTCEEIEFYLEELVLEGILDIDGNGVTDALTDAILIPRYLSGIRGDQLIDSAVDLNNCTRCTAIEIEAYIEELVKIPPLGQIANILNFFDQSVTDGALVGKGPGNSAQGRLNALRNMIEAAGNLIVDDNIEEACQQLQDVFNRTDGQFPPPDFVAGSAASELAELIQNLRNDLECDLDILSDELLAAGNLILNNNTEKTCQRLRDIFNRIDEQLPPYDFVVGNAASELAELIQNLRSDLECDVDALNDELLNENFSESTSL